MKSCSSLCLLLLVVPLGFARGDSKSDAARMASAFREKTAIQGEPTVPFHLSANVHATINEPIDGTYILYWAGIDRWREAIVLGDYNEITVRSGDQKWTDRNLAFPPYVVGQLRDLVGLVKRSYLPKQEKIKKVRNPKGQEQLICAEFEASGSSREDCFDKASGLLKTTSTRGVEEGKTKEYADYRAFGSKEFPRLLRLKEGNKQRLEVQVEILAPQEADETKYAGLPGRDPIRTCQDMKAPKAVYAPDPEYSSEARKANLEGISTLWLQIGADGKIMAAAVVRPLGLGLDEKALSAVRTWKFEPALCGSVPVQSEVAVEVHFHLR